jgi:transketolase
MDLQKKEYAKLLRALVLESTTLAGSGHPSSCLSCIEVMTELFVGNWYHPDPKDYLAPHSDQLIFSKGHAAPLLYSLFCLTGDVSRQELLTLRKLGSRLEGHPLPSQLPFVAAATGSLGQGIGVGIGTALSQKRLSSDAKTYVVLGDSECAEGSVWESLQIASHYKLDNLVLMVDVNRLGQRGETMLGHDVETLARRFAAFGAQVVVAKDGHNFEELQNCFTALSPHNGKPKVLIAKTLKGKGISFLEDKEGWHGKVLNSTQYEQALSELGEINYSLCNSISFKSQEKVPQQSPSVQLQNTQASYTGPVSTRKAYGDALVSFSQLVPQLLALDAETSNSTFASALKESNSSKFLEMYIAEQNMVSSAIGLNKVGKYIPCVSTFGAFLTRCFDQIRIATYSDAHLVLVGSHAGSSIGEDGVSQMALEDLAMMRSILGSNILCPSDGVSTHKLLALLLQNSGINYLRLSRGEVPLLYSNNSIFTLGGSTTLQSNKNDICTIFASGITVHEALKAYEVLAAQGVFVSVIDMYSIKPIDKTVIEKACKQTNRLIVVEDHYTEGGLYSAIVETGVVTKPIISLAVTKMPHSDTPNHILSESGIDSNSIVQAVLSLNIPKRNQPTLI